MPLIGEPSPLTADDKPADIYVSGVVCRMLLDQFHCLDICIVVCEAILALERRHARSIYRHVPPFNSTTPRHARVRKVPLRYFFNSNFPRYTHSVRYGTRLGFEKGIFATREHPREHWYKDHISWPRVWMQGCDCDTGFEKRS